MSTPLSTRRVAARLALGGAAGIIGILARQWYEILPPFAVESPVYLASETSETSTIVELWVAHPECSDGYDGPVRFEVSEGVDSIEVRGYTRRRFGLGCSSVLAPFRATVEVSATIGARPIVDGSSEPLRLFE